MPGEREEKASNGSQKSHQPIGVLVASGAAVRGVYGIGPGYFN